MENEMENEMENDKQAICKVCPFAIECELCGFTPVCLWELAQVEPKILDVL